MASRIQHTLVAMLSLALWATACTSCSSDPKPTRRFTDPLSLEEVERELRTLPRPAEEVFRALNAKQNYFPDWGLNWRDDVHYDPDLVQMAVERVAKNPEAEIHWAEDHSVSDAVALKSISSWDAYTGGDHQQVRSTGDWVIFFDEAEYVIGYTLDLSLSR